MVAALGILAAVSGFFSFSRDSRAGGCSSLPLSSFIPFLIISSIPSQNTATPSSPNFFCSPSISYSFSGAKFAGSRTAKRNFSRVDFLSAAHLTWHKEIPRQSRSGKRSRSGAVDVQGLIRKAVGHENTAHSGSDTGHCRDRSCYCASLFGG